jgi:hypothetical protein
VKETFRKRVNNCRSCSSPLHCRQPDQCAYPGQAAYAVAEGIGLDKAQLDQAVTIQPEEWIVGSHLAIPEDKDSIRLGFYDRHYPPGHATILRMGLPGIRDHARARWAQETDPHQREFLQAVEIAYDAACRYVARHAAHARTLAAEELVSHRARVGLHRLIFDPVWTFARTYVLQRGFLESIPLHCWRGMPFLSPL